MTMNITYLSRGSAGAVYADVHGSKRFTADEFPVLELLAPHITDSDLYFHLRQSYQGTGMNPFLTEAFVTALNTGRIGVFNMTHVPGSLPLPNMVAKRFDITPAKFLPLVTKIGELFPHLKGVNLTYYAATLYMACAGKNLTGTTANANRIIRALKICKQRGRNVMPGGEHLALLSNAADRLIGTMHIPAPSTVRRSLRAEDKTFDERWREIERVLASLLMFKTDEARRIITEQPLTQWALPGRIKDAMGCENYAEVEALRAGMADSILEGLLPAWE